jgi:hypothetical protein
MRVYNVVDEVASREMKLGIVLRRLSAIVRKVLYLVATIVF